MDGFLKFRRGTWRSYPPNVSNGPPNVSHSCLLTADDASCGRDEESREVPAAGRAAARGPPPRRYCPSTRTVLLREHYHTNYQITTQIAKLLRKLLPVRRIDGR